MSNRKIALQIAREILRSRKKTARSLFLIKYVRYHRVINIAKRHFLKMGRNFVTLLLVPCTLSEKLIKNGTFKKDGGIPLEDCTVLSLWLELVKHRLVKRSEA